MRSIRGSALLVEQEHLQWIQGSEQDPATQYREQTQTQSAVLETVCYCIFLLLTLTLCRNLSSIESESLSSIVFKNCKLTIVENPQSFPISTDQTWMQSELGAKAPWLGCLEGATTATTAPIPEGHTDLTVTCYDLDLQRVSAQTRCVLWAPIIRLAECLLCHSSQNIWCETQRSYMIRIKSLSNNVDSRNDFA